MNRLHRTIIVLSKYASVVIIYTVIFASAASAALITRSDFSGSETLETFSNPISAGPSVTTNGVTYTSANSILFKATSWDTFFPNVPDISTGGALADNTAVSDVSVAFSTQVNRLGFYLTTGGNSLWQVDVFGDNNQLLGSNTYNTWGSNPSVGAAFVGFEFADNISSFRVLQTGGGFVFIMDDLRYETVNAVSESSMLVFVLIGVMCLLKRRVFKQA